MKTSPIVIIGAARSGTSFLRDLLAEAPGLCAVPYDVNYIWRYGQGALSSDDLQPGSLSDRQKHFIQSNLARLSNAGNEAQILEKTVSNTLRIGFVDRVLPDAKFVYIERDGRDATASAMRQWAAKPNWAHWYKKLRSLPFGSLPYAIWAAKNLAAGSGRAQVWGPRYPGIDADMSTLSLAQTCAKQWLVCCEMARAGLKEIAPERVYRITYEALQKSPAPLAELLEWAQLGEADPVLQAYKKRLRMPQNLFDQLPAQDRNAIHQQLSHFLSEQGYI